MIALVTVHGIGFQQPPSLDGKVAGYADHLHDNLRQVLQGDLGDDPDRVTRGQHGPVYVQSNWPPFEGPTEDGVKRIGTWADPAHTQIDASTAPALISAGRIAHVVLVYSGLEEQQWDPATLFPLGALALPALSHYASARGVIHMAIHDVEGILHHKAGPGSGSPSLSIRSDRPNAKVRVRPDQPAPPALGTAGLPGASVLDAVKQVEDDVGGYVARNELRERVRVFVTESIARLCARTDVEQVILNTHSNGTVAGFDALKALDPLLAQKVGAFVTAGSPLRKYVSLLSWGSDCGQIAGVPRWLNFWDDADPVADPLDPGMTWKRGDPFPDAAAGHLFADVQSVPSSPKAIEEYRIDNLHHSDGGGLQAHNYWDNQNEFVKPLAGLMAPASP
jgi:hypothetical protein